MKKMFSLFTAVIGLTIGVFSQAPTPIVPDSILQGEIGKNVKLHNTKIYGLKGYVYVNEGGVLEIEPGTIIVGDEPGTNSALIINRGGKIIAEGTRKDPIVFTSRASAGQRNRGDWGGVIICGKAKTNHPGGQAAIEGGIADGTTGGKGWFGGTDDNDNSGILKYVRIEFAGIAVSPNNELNGLTLGAVGRGTTIQYVQVSYGNDDSFEWFGGCVNAKYLVSIGTLDDDFDTDNGFSGNIQFGLAQRFRTIADVSTSQTFESDNDAQASYNKPMTSAIFSNITGIGPIQDTSWTQGMGEKQFNPRFGAAVHIRRNSRQSIQNSVFIGWPRGIDISQVPTMIAAAGDSIKILNNSWFGIKGATLTLAGGTPPTGITPEWLLQKKFGNVVEKSTPDLAMIQNPFIYGPDFNPALIETSPLREGASFEGLITTDGFFQPVSFRGAFGIERWDLGWTEYDPVNKEYKAKTPVSVQEETYQSTVNVYPNPSKTSSVIRYNLQQDDNITIQLSTETGTIVSTFIKNETQTAGIYEFNLITSDLRSGMYFITIVGGNGIMNLPISVVK